MKWISDFFDWLSEDDSGVRIIIFVIIIILFIGVLFTGGFELSTEEGRTIDDSGWQSPGN